jgi:DNA-binding MarR family transcriptional regulator
MQEKMPLLLENQLCFRLYAATRAMTQAYQPILAPLGLTYPQYLVMLVLWEKDGLSVKAIGHRLNLDSGTLTPLLKRLEGQGLVRRVRSQQDERVVEIRLTAPGRRLREEAAAVPHRLACRIGVDLDLISSLTAGLDQLIARLHGSGHAAETEADEPLA